MSGRCLISLVFWEESSLVLSEVSISLFSTLSRFDSSFLRFVISVRFKDPQSLSSTSLSWEVGRRFSEFDQLHSDLKLNHNLTLLPKLPPKTVLSSSLSDGYLEKRRLSLEKMLHRMLARVDIRTTQTFRRFLEFDTHTDFNPAKMVQAAPVCLATVEDCRFGVSGCAVAPLPGGGLMVMVGLEDTSSLSRLGR